MNSFEEELKVAFDQCPSIKDTVWLKEGNITLYEVAIHLHNKYSLDNQRVAEAIDRRLFSLEYKKKEAQEKLKHCDAGDTEDWIEYLHKIEFVKNELICLRKELGIGTEEKV